MPYGLIATDSITDSSGGVLAPSSSVFRNRILNGAMQIDQRNAGASVTATVTSARTYLLDRWGYFSTQASKFTAQQNAASVTPPAGFTNYLGITSSSAYSPISSDIILLQQPIEGFNVADLAWGTASAATVTLSFWVRSSLTGTFAGSLGNSANNRLYPFTFTINSANTWEKETITIVGDTSGTWVTNNGVGLYLNFNLGTGSTYLGTAGSWSGSAYYSATGGTNVVGTNGATFYITGVQLEKGTTATSFDYRPYGTELSLCQRYYYKTFPQGTVPAQNTGSIAGALLISTSATSTFGGSISLPVTMRSAPSTVTTYNPSAANASWRDTNNSADRTVGSASGGDSSLYVTGLSGIVNGLNLIHVTATAEL